MAEYSREDLLKALRAADAAGDSAAATAIAKRLQSQKTTPATVTPTATPSEMAPEGFTRAGGLPAASAGVAGEALRAFYGLKDTERKLLPTAALLRQTLGGGTPEEDKGILAEIAKEEAEDPNKGQRAAGGIAAKVGMTLAPGMAATKGLAMLPQTARTLSIPAAGAAVSGAEGYALTPGLEGQKEKEAVESAMWGAAIPSGAQLLKKTLTKPFEASKEALDLMAQKIYPTLQQGAEKGSIGRFLGGLTSGAFETGQRQNKEVIDATARKIAPNFEPSPDMGVSEIYGSVRASLKQELDSLLSGKTFTLTQPGRSHVWAGARGPAGTQPAATALAAKKLGETGPALQSTTPTRMGQAKLQEYQGLLQDAVDSIGKKGTINEIARQNLQKAKVRFNDIVRDQSLSLAERALAKDLDERMEDFVKFGQAARKSSFHTEPTATKLAKQYEGDEAFAAGEHRMQQELLEPAIRIMGLRPTQESQRAFLTGGKRAAIGLGAGGGLVSLGNPVIGVPLGAAYLTSLAGQTKGGARALFGDFAAQKRLAELMKTAEPAAYSAGYSLTGD